MREANKTRTQRRMERRHAIVLLVLLLAASLASFIVGVFVGRHGCDAGRSPVVEVAGGAPVSVAPQQPVPQRPVPARVDPYPAAAEAEVAGAKSEPGAEPGAEPERQEQLSFYDDLSGESEPAAEPLGSGINLAPAEEVKPPVPLAEQPVVVKTVAADAVQTRVQESPAVSAVAPLLPAAAGQPPQVAASGTHAVQIGSFGTSKDAAALKNRMLKSGYNAYMVEADLGAKGLWYRVKIGPYAGSAAAGLAQKYLQEYEQIKGFVTRK